MGVMCRSLFTLTNYDLLLLASAHHFIPTPIILEREYMKICNVGLNYLEDINLGQKVGNTEN